jgi:LPXTG-motif cell wall-anchored protein
MRTLGLVIGLLAVLAGVVWTLQGVGILPGSFMSSNPTWVIIGLVTVVVGIGLVAWSRRRARTGA